MVRIFEGRFTMKGSEKIMLSSIAFGAVVAGGVNWLFPQLPWWGFLIITFFAGGSVYDHALKQAAAEKIIDRGDWPTKDAKRDADTR